MTTVNETREANANTTSERLAAILRKAGINTTSVRAYGSQAVIDSFAKYEKEIAHLMTQGGFDLVLSRNGIHLDDKTCLRMWFRVKSA